ncbi:NB-ARC domain-containing protein [Actinoplanes sp. NPDC089786]|uniref:NB-ARC domain-containing protein n=1 Tax=Actinoplanes sp. NPDC089786 TaxID=3155185 RepID=UPI003422D967
MDRDRGAVKYEFIQRLADGWSDLADLTGTSAAERARWRPGYEAGEIWDWLEVRRRLRELPELCVRAGRPDLAAILTGALTGAGSRPMMVPAANRVRIARSGLHQQVLDAFRGDAGSTVGVTAGVRGTGGFGKTTLAEMVTADPRVRDTFPGGILWVEVGNAPEGRIPIKIHELVQELTGPAAVAVDPRRAGGQLAEALGGERTLLVIDDVWTPGQLAPFQVGAPSCVRLVTTRNAASLPRGSRSVPVEEMQPDEARDLLLYGVDRPGSDEVVARLLTMSGRWPLLLGLINGALVRLVEQGNSTDDSLAEVETRLRADGPSSFDADRPQSRRDAVDTTLAASLHFLRPDHRERYLELAIFPETAPVPLTALRRWWGSTGGLDDAAVRKLCLLLAEQSLILRYQLNPPQIHLHDVVVQSLRGLLGPQRLTRMRGQWLDLQRPLTPQQLDDDED